MQHPAPHEAQFAAHLTGPQEEVPLRQGFGHKPFANQRFLGRGQGDGVADGGQERVVHKNIIVVAAE
ncbi:hypothetical protein GCM10027422_07850 [Hymenobacter arcticus]